MPFSGPKIFDGFEGGDPAEVICCDADAEQPFASVIITEKLPVEEMVIDWSVLPLLQRYSENPLPASNAIGFPWQMEKTPLGVVMEVTGRLFTKTFTDAVAVQLFASVPVTVYDAEEAG